ncbi:glycoside hydrolase family 15 protein [Actinomadura viridis]|uniref:GH15 family glucan-1,4-alpha-glucosidase n=1 Tax=Actinomadura viridis TaxID=58110 RepID=A0A931DWD3_9ACTN|nr:glycoside hydrolase family 15 protein [Actinomadura viridis]MBG6093953.1 hypothetical protein [Actinomadura viridis]
MGIGREGPYALREYAVIADGERGALVGPHGNCVWMCFPSWESPALFDALTGGMGGYAVRPADPWHVWGGHYEDRGLIWRSRWVTGHGVIECREALARPASRDRALLLRQVQALNGPARIRVDLDVRADFSRCPMSSRRLADGLWTARSGGVRIRWAGAEAARPAGPGGGLALFIDLEPGRPHDLVLELSAREPAGPLEDARPLWEATEAAWRASVPSCADTLAPRDAQLSYAVLTGLTSSSGGMVAAATTSLPERIGGDRDYDYRYAWIRDQCYAGQAVAIHGARLELLDTAVGFVAERVLSDGPRLRPVYTVDGRPVPPERPVPLPGYPGARMIVGNRAGDQFQLDAFGEALLLFATARRADRLPREAAAAARVATRVIAERWNEPEAGIWETADRRWAHSRLICVAGLRATAGHAESENEAARMLALADEIMAATTASSLAPEGHWWRAPDDHRIDASLLLPVLRGALPADDPRATATMEKVRDALVQDGFVYRYKVDDRPLGEAEGAFTLCGFLLALVEYQCGEAARALRRFERIRSGCGTSGLFTEEYDVRQRQLRANLPQAFVHALFLETATRLAR